MLPDLVVVLGPASTGISCVAVPGWAVVTVAGLLAGPAAIRAWAKQ